MSIDLNQIAATVEQYMIATVLVQRVTGTIMDEVSMVETDQYATVYEGKAMVSPMGDPASTEVANRDLQRTQYEVGLPRDAGEVLPNDVITVLTGPDPALVDQRLIVHDSIRATFFTHRRVKAWLDKAST